MQARDNASSLAQLHSPMNETQLRFAIMTVIAFAIAMTALFYKFYRFILKKRHPAKASPIINNEKSTSTKRPPVKFHHSTNDIRLPTDNPSHASADNPRRVKRSESTKSERKIKTQFSILARKDSKAIEKTEKTAQKKRHTQGAPGETPHKKPVKKKVQESKKQKKDKEKIQYTTNTPVSSYYDSKRSRIAIQNLHKHAKFISTFTYKTSPDREKLATDTSSKTLAFMYHFHRYNLMLLVLSENEVSNDTHASAINLRRLLVHKTGTTSLNPLMIKETQRQMNTFIANQVAELEQQHTHYWVKSDRRQANLVETTGHSVTALTLDSIDTTTLYSVFNYEQNNKSQTRNTSSQINDTQFYLWFTTQMLPFMDYLHNNANLADKKTKSEFYSAIKMLLVITGEYCKPKQYNRFKQNKIYPLLAACNRLRNKISHDIKDITDDEIDDFFGFARRIMEIQPHDANPLSFDIFTSPGIGCEKGLLSLSRNTLLPAPQSHSKKEAEKYHLTYRH